MENTRICTICKSIKPFSDFNWDNRFNLPFSRCKKCYNEKCKQYRQSKIGKETCYKWQQSSEGKSVRSKAIKKWRQNNKDKRDAHTAVHNALRDKKLIKMPCVKCNNPISEGHHWSYDKKNWLDVIWLCKLHHTEITYSDNPHNAFI